MAEERVVFKQVTVFGHDNIFCKGLCKFLPILFVISKSLFNE